MLTNERAAERVHPEFDGEASLKETLLRLPIDRVLEHFGAKLSGKKLECPFCHETSCVGLFMATDGATLFKFHSTSCPSETKAMGPAFRLA